MKIICSEGKVYLRFVSEICKTLLYSIHYKPIRLVLMYVMRDLLTIEHSELHPDV